jgi:hypothetical protein
VTVNWKLVPAVAPDGAETANWVADPPVTAIVLLVPIIVVELTSVTVIVCGPAAVRVALKLVVEPLTGEFAGSVPPDVLVNVTVPV